jgi:hypothetical protein
VRPLTEEIWLSIHNELQAGADIPLSDSLYCDALLSIVAGDQMKALVEAGVAAEVAITQLLLEVSHSEPSSPSKREFRNKQGDHHRFKDKLTKWPQKLGLQGVAQCRIHGTPPDWVSIVQKLYQLRNGVAHAGKLKPGATAHDVTSSLFAVNALLEYCRVQRARVGLSDYTMPNGTTSFGQTMMCHAGLITAESSPCEALLP